MRTTLSIDDDVLAAVKGIAAVERSSVGEVVSRLARQALHPVQPPVTVRNGVPLLAPLRTDLRATADLVRQLDEETQA